MKYNHYLAVMLASSLAACGGGSGTPTLESLASAVASSASSTAVLQKTTLAQGVVTGFGSVIVNGVHYDVKNADIDVDGDSLVESELGIGQIVRITGSVDADGIHGKAIKLEGESQVRGAIESIDVAAGILVAVGQTIIINAETFYADGVTAETLKVGDLIKVSALTSADGKLVATRIDLKTGSATDVAQLAGKIADLDTTALTFTINGKTVDYSKAVVADGITLANDMLLRVRGSLVEGIFVASGTLQASPLSIKHDQDIGQHDGLAVGGLITDVIANTSFKINDATVLLAADTQYEGGTAADLASGLLVKVKGTLDANNNLVASKIKLILQPRVNENGLVDSVDLALNTLTVNGVSFAVTVDTSFNDSGKDKVRLFSLSDLAVGNTINVHGYKVTATATVAEHMVATRVERRFPSSNSADRFKVDVHGLVESVVGSTIKVAGRSVTLDADTLIIGFDSLEAFLAAALGADIEVKGVIENGVFVATSIEPSDDDAHGGGHHSDSSRAFSSRSADSSAPADDAPGHSRSSKSADANRSSDAAHSFSSRSATSRQSRSESSVPAQPSSEGAFSSRSAMSRPSRSESSASVPAQPSSEGAVSSRSAKASSASAQSFSSRSAKAERSSASSRAPRSAPAGTSSQAAASSSAAE